MSITPKAIQDLLDELEASKQSRLRAWNVLHRLRLVLSELGKRCHPSTSPEDVRCRGRSFGTRFDQILASPERGDQSLCSSVRRFRDATIKEECKSDYPHALQALWKDLDRAEDLIQSRTDGTGNKD
jgi:hypothetical protein